MRTRSKVRIELRGPGKDPFDGKPIEWFMDCEGPVSTGGPALFEFGPARPDMTIAKVIAPAGYELKCKQLFGDEWIKTDKPEIVVAKPFVLKEGKYFTIQVKRQRAESTGEVVEPYLSHEDPRIKLKIAAGLAAIARSIEDGVTLASAAKKIGDLGDPSIYNVETRDMWLRFAAEFSRYYHGAILAKELADAWVEHVLRPQHGQQSTALRYVKAREAIVERYHPNYLPLKKPPKKATHPRLKSCGHDREIGCKCTIEDRVGYEHVATEARIWWDLLTQDEKEHVATWTERASDRPSVDHPLWKAMIDGPIADFSSRPEMLIATTVIRELLKVPQYVRSTMKVKIKGTKVTYDYISSSVARP